MTRRRAALAIGIVAALLCFALKDVNWTETRALLGRIGLLAFAALTLPGLAALSSETRGWRSALASLGHRVAYPMLLRVRLSAEALAQTLPLGTVWCESIKPALLARHCRLPATVSIGAMVARKYILLASQSAFLLIVFCVSFAPLRAASASMIGHAGLEWLPLAVAVALALGAVALRTTFTRGAIAERVFRLLERLPIAALRRCVTGRRSAFVESDREIARFFALPSRSHARAAVWVLVAWFLESVETWLFLRALGADASLPTAMAIESLAVLIRHIFVLLPAGLGAQEVGYVALMAATGVGDASFAAAFALLKRGKELVWCAVGYGFLLGDRMPTPPRRSAPTPALPSASYS